MRFTPFVLALALSAPAAAYGDAPNPADDPEVARLLQAKSTVRWTHVPAGRSERYGHAETLTEATPERVRQVASDYAHLKDLHKKFASARIVDKQGDDVDVYMKLPVRVGPFTVDQWEVLRFGPPKSVGNTYVVEGRGVRGNMKSGHVVITVRPVDARHSLIKVDILLVPGMPAPQSMVDEELRDAALDLANGLKDKAQGWVGPVQSL